jgi:hypothetical protein
LRNSKIQKKYGYISDLRGFEVGGERINFKFCKKKLNLLQKVKPTPSLPHIPRHMKKI